MSNDSPRPGSLRAGRNAGARTARWHRSRLCRQRRAARLRPGDHSETRTRAGGAGEAGRNVLHAVRSFEPRIAGRAARRTADRARRSIRRDRHGRRERRLDAASACSAHRRSPRPRLRLPRRVSRERAQRLVRALTRSSRHRWRARHGVSRSRAGQISDACGAPSCHRAESEHRLSRSREGDSWLDAVPVRRVRAAVHRCL